MPIANDVTKFDNGIEEIPVPSLLRAASGNVAGDGYGKFKEIRAVLNVTDANGTDPTLDVVIEDSVDGGTTWNELVAFTQATGVTAELKTYTGAHGDRVRVRWTIAGTDPDFTFSVKWHCRAAA